MEIGRTVRVYTAEPLREPVPGAPEPVHEPVAGAVAETVVDPVVDPVVETVAETCATDETATTPVR